MENFTDEGIDNIFDDTEAKANYWRGMATLLFVYAPSVNIVGAIYGPRLGGFLAYGTWGLASATLICIGTAVFTFIEHDLAHFIGIFLASLGMINFFTGIIQNNNRSFNPEKRPNSLRKLKWDITVRFFLYPVLYLMSPALFLFIKLQTILRPSSKLVKYQNMVCSRGECMYESTPQLCFQLYILLSSLQPSWTASLSMITSALSLSVPNIEKFLHSRGKVDIWNILKYLPIFFFNSIFKVASLSIIFVFFKILSLAFFPLHVILNIMFGARMKRNHFLLNETSNDLNQQGCEVLLSCFTITNLQHTRVAGLYRLQNTFLCLLTKSLILITIAAICNIAPDTVTVPSITGDIVWAELPIVQDIFLLNLMVGLTLACGLLSLVLDMVYNKFEYGAVFNEHWDEFTSLTKDEALKNRKAHSQRRKEWKAASTKCFCCGMMWCCDEGEDQLSKEIFEFSTCGAYKYKRHYHRQEAVTGSERRFGFSWMKSRKKQKQKSVNSNKSPREVEVNQ